MSIDVYTDRIPHREIPFTKWIWFGGWKINIRRYRSSAEMVTYHLFVYFNKIFFNILWRNLAAVSSEYSLFIITISVTDDCRLVTNARERRLCSTESRTCVVTRTHSTFGDTAFAAAGPGLWNSLPPHLRDADLPYSRFQRSLKTFLFG